MYFPGFPWLLQGIRALLPSINPKLVVLATSGLLSIFTLVLFFLFFLQLKFRSDWKSNFYRAPEVWLGLALLAFFPNNHFWANGYAEPLQAMCFLLTFLCIIQKKIPLAGVFVGLAGIVRNQGSWLMACFVAFIVYDQLQSHWKSRAQVKAKRLFNIPFKEACLSVGLAILPTLGFMAWQWLERGNPFYWVELMRQGGRRVYFLDVLLTHVPQYNWSYGLLVFSYVTGFRFILRNETIWKFIGVMTIMLAVLPLPVGGFIGYGRYMGASLGLFISAAEMLVALPWLYYPIIGWFMFQLAVEVDGWTVGLWRG
jgi:hypothetical protein